MKSIGHLAILCLLSLSMSCKKKEGVNQNLDPTKQEGSNYMSTKLGSWWLFGARNGDITRRMATGKEETKNGLLFSRFDKRDENPNVDPSLWKSTPEYFGRNGINYVSLYDFDGAQTNYATLVFLQDNATTWTNTEDYTYQGVKINLEVQSKVEFTDGTLTLGDKTYDKVTKVHHDLRGKIPPLVPSYIDAGTLDVWFAKGIGIIKQDIDAGITVLGKTYIEKKHTDSLLSYHIEE